MLLRQSEAACVELRRSSKRWPWRRGGRVLWSISAADERTDGQLREKSRSKMDAAKLPAGLFSAVRGLLLKKVGTIVKNA